MEIDTLSSDGQCSGCWMTRRPKREDIKSCTLNTNRISERGEDKVHYKTGWNVKEGRGRKSVHVIRFLFYLYLS